MDADLDTAGVESLLDRLKVDDGDHAVISFAARANADPAQLVFASALFAPEELARQSWPAWVANSHRPGAYLAAMWEAAGVDLGAWVDFIEERAGWIFGRRVVGPATALADVGTWLTQLLSGEVATVPQGPNVVADVGAAAGLIRTFQHLTGPAALLVNAAHRPTTGYFFPRREPLDVDAPTTWDVGGYPLTAAPLWILGLPITDTPLHSRPFDHQAPPVQGVYVGRLERRAWISGLRAEPGSQTYDMTLGIDERHAHLAELEVDLEEFIDGDLIAARRLRLGDIKLPASPIPIDHQVVLALPSLGPSLHRQVRLYDRDGALLDISDRVPTLDKVEFVGAVGGEEGIAGAVGEVPLVGLLARLERADAVDAAYTQLLADGLAGRIIDDPAAGLPILTGLLQEAHGHLAVLDPYFGWAVGDWQVLQHAAGHVRVLTGHGNGRVKKDGSLDQKVTVPPAGTAPAATSFEARSWRNGKPPWHDRFYIWAGGGLSVGTSPTGLGKRVARIDRINAVEAAGLQSLFDTWWVSANVAAL